RGAADGGWEVDLERSGSAVARHGAPGCRRVGVADRVSTGELLAACRAGFGRFDRGPRCEPVPADEPGTWIFISGRRASGYAHGSKPWHDSGRSAELQCRKGNRRLAPPAWRRKESAEDSRSNRSSAAHSEHTAPGGCSGTGRTSDGTFAPRDSDLY